MLAGQDISFAQSIVISLSGMAIVMLELVLLALVIIALSRIIAKFEKKDTPQKAVAPAPAQVVTAIHDENDDELAAVMVAVCEESKIPLNEIVFKNIQKL